MNDDSDEVEEEDDETEFESLRKKYGIERKDSRPTGNNPLRENLSPLLVSSKRAEDDTMENVSSTDARNLRSQSELSNEGDLRQQTFSDEGVVKQV